MATRKKRIFLSVASLLLLIAAITVYMIWNKPHKNVEDAGAIPVAAATFYNQFISDSLAAKKNYVDKVLLVSGRIERLTVNQQSQTIVLLGTGTAGGYINCTMEKAPAALKEQDSVSIKGICSGYISGDADMGLPGDVFLTRCYLSK